MIKQKNLFNLVAIEMGFWSALGDTIGDIVTLGGVSFSINFIFLIWRLILISKSSSCSKRGEARKAEQRKADAERRAREAQRLQREDARRQHEQHQRFLERMKGIVSHGTFV